MATKLGLRQLLKLSNVVRTGWLVRGVPPCLAENSMEHSYLVALMALLICRRLRDKGLNVDVERALQMALIHDVPEAITGDVLSWIKEGLDMDSHERRALEAMGLGEFVDLLHEFNEGQSLEAKVVRAADEVATLLVATEYARRGYEEVKELAKSILGKLKSPSGVPELDETVREIVRELGEDGPR
ncbi:MAG: HD domain-containing protein [Desulfurococcaceae archaeon]